MRLVFNPYSNKSLGLKNLRREIESRGIPTLELKTRGSRYTPGPSDTIVNWGVPKERRDMAEYNDNSSLAANKLATLRTLASINPLLFITSKQFAIDNFFSNNGVVYCRTKLYSTRGQGIIVAHSPEEIVDAPLYTLGVPKIPGYRLREYRVHVFQGTIIDYVEKRKLSSENLEARGLELNPLIRNHENGYIFARTDVTLPGTVRDIAVTSLTLMHLDFGAIDIVWNGQDAYVLEVNSAPGIEGSSVRKYADAFISLLSI